MIRYKIKEFTNEMGITTDLAKHYEKYGIIKPEIDNNTNYRYYNIEQGERVIFSKQFRNLGFTIKESADLISNKNLNDITSILNMKSHELRDNVNLLNHYVNKLDYITHISQKFISSDTSWEIRKSPGIYFLKQTDNKFFSQDEVTKQRIKEWLDLLPVTFEALKIHQGSITDRKLFLYNWGIGVHEGSINQLKIDISQPVQYIGPQKVLIYYLNFVCGAGMGISQFEEAVNLTRKLNLRISGDILCEFIMVTNEKNKRLKHFVMYIPVE